MSNGVLLRNKLSSNITSYDLLKALAVIAMVIDHMGYYFFPEQLWFRAIGRLCVPAWMFLIGYAEGRDITVKLWGGALLLLAMNFIVGMHILSMNILVTIIFIRLFINFFAKTSLKNKQGMYGVSIILFVMVIPSYVVFEYGALAVILSMFGWFIRHKKEINKDVITGFMFFSCFSFVIYQQVYFGFSNAQFIFLLVGVLIVNMVLYYFSSREFISLTDKSPKFFVNMIQLLGRRTLEIYVLHLMLFKFLALYLGYDDYGLFEFKFIDLSMFDMNPVRE